jgi:tRNA (guanosine-2'-O-)-methyltransferase
MKNDSPLEQFVIPERLERLENVLSKRSDKLIVVLDNIKNAHNISAVIRSADAFGLSSVYLVGDTFEYSRGISLGAERWLELKKFPLANDAITALKKEGFKLVMLQPEFDERKNSDKPSLAVSTLPFEEKLALVFGNEMKGVSPEFAEAVDLHAYIPMKGFVESLNISVACAITLFCSTIKESAPTQRTQLLEEKEKLRIKNLWLKKSVRKSDLILKEIEKGNK